jgi:Spy/CpxP family protein refolding chaperone
MFRRKTLTAPLFAALGLIVLVAANPAVAAFGDPSHAAMLDGFDMKGSDFTQEQFRRVMNMVSAHQQIVAPIDEQIRAIRQEISTQLSGSTPVDVDHLASLQQQTAALQSQRDQLDLQLQLDFRSVLTPAQQAQAADHTQKLVASHQTKVPATLSNSPSFQGEPKDLYGDTLGYSRGVSLTSDQQAKVAAAIAASAVRDATFRAQFRAISDQIGEQLASTRAVSLADLVPLQQQASALNSQRDAERLNLAIQARSVLTPLQLGQAAELHEQQLSMQSREKDLLKQAKTQN